MSISPPIEAITAVPAVPVPAVPEDRLLADLPEPWGVDPVSLAAQVAAGRKLVVLDDDPTGTQSVADLPVLTSWSVADLRWALAQPTPGFFVLTNSRSLSGPDAAHRNREIVDALVEAARVEGVAFVVASRSDSTLRGHYPLETDVLAAELATRGTTVDGVVIVPAYIEPGRLTIDSLHWMRTDLGMIPVGQSEFARDATFGYRCSDLRAWVEEKTGGRITAGDVVAVTVADLRVGGPERVHAILRTVDAGRPVVVDAASDDDLRVLVEALLLAEAEGMSFIYRTGPSFVRARSGQQATPPITSDRLRRIITDAEPATGTVADPRPTSRRGLIVIGSHVGLTTRQLDRLRAAGGIVEVVLEVPTLLDPASRDVHVREVAEQAAALLAAAPPAGAEADVVVRTSRTPVAGADAEDSLSIARIVSAALVEVVRRIIIVVRPGHVLAKGGITSSDTATAGLAIRRAWARGTLLPGIVSLWEPVSGPARGIPYVVFAGNVGDDDALVSALTTLRGS